MKYSPHIIYGLFDPNTGELRYIGYTSDERSRYRHHHNKHELRLNTHKNNWLKTLLVNGQKSELFVLERYDTAEQLPQAEIELIEYYRSIGCRLTNGTNGGDGAMFGAKHSEETKRKMSESSRKYSAERSKLASTLHKGNKTWLGRKHSEASKKKMSNSAKGNTNPLGSKRSEETKRKLAVAATGRKHSEETKKLFSEQRKGRIPWNKGLKIQKQNCDILPSVSSNSTEDDSLKLGK